MYFRIRVRLISWSALCSCSATFFLLQTSSKARPLPTQQPADGQYPRRQVTTRSLHHWWWPHGSPQVGQLHHILPLILVHLLLLLLPIVLSFQLPYLLYPLSPHRPPELSFVFFHSPTPMLPLPLFFFTSCLSDSSSFMSFPPFLLVLSLSPMVFAHLSIILFLNISLLLFPSENLWKPIIGVLLPGGFSSQQQQPDVCHWNFRTADCSASDVDCWCLCSL